WDFEVVVAVDARCGREGRDPSRVGIEAGLRRPFRVRRVTSLRQPAYRHLPHRNHARNAGCNAAEGEHLWVLDADMIPDPRAVEHLKAIVRDRKSTRLNSSHVKISYAVFCLKKKTNTA